MSINEKLKEMTDRAAKSSSQALSKLISDEVGVEVTNLEVAEVQKGLKDLGPEDMVVGVYVEITGDLNGSSLLVFPEKIAYDLCDLLVKRELGTTQKLTDLDKSALKEVGNIICGSFSSVFSNTLNIKMIEHPPKLSFDMLGAVTDQVIAEYAKKGGEALIIEVKFDFQREKIEGYIALIFGVEEMEAIMGALEKSEK